MPEGKPPEVHIGAGRDLSVGIGHKVHAALADDEGDIGLGRSFVFQTGLERFNRFANGCHEVAVVVERALDIEPPRSLSGGEHHPGFTLDHVGKHFRVCGATYPEVVCITLERGHGCAKILFGQKQFPVEQCGSHGGLRAPGLARHPLPVVRRAVERVDVRTGGHPLPACAGAGGVQRRRIVDRDDLAAGRVVLHRLGERLDQIDRVFGIEPVEIGHMHPGFPIVKERFAPTLLRSGDGDLVEGDFRLHPCRSEFGLVAAIAFPHPLAELRLRGRRVIVHVLRVPVRPVDKLAVVEADDCIANDTTAC